MVHGMICMLSQPGLFSYESAVFKRTSKLKQRWFLAIEIFIFSAV